MEQQAVSYSGDREVTLKKRRLMAIGEGGEGRGRGRGYFFRCKIV